MSNKKNQGGRVKIIKVKLDGFASCSYPGNKEGIISAMEEIQSLIATSIDEFTDSRSANSISITFGEMSQDEYYKLPEFQGY